MEKTDTIAAISTGMTSSGIGIIRLSGEEAVRIADSLFKGAASPLSLAASHTIHYGSIVEGERLIDEVLVSVMRAPSTYTREDVVEINCHGGIAVMREVLAAVIRAGARLAQPGEFTRRAFLNGRIDLSQAEAVMDLIQAKNRIAMDASLRQIRGDLRKRIEYNKDQILQTIATIEAALDDPEHFDTGQTFREEIVSSMEQSLTSLKELLETFESGRVAREGIKAVIVGKPNAGKSSIMNVLLGENRAIVTDIAGTTRDTLEESMNMDGILFNIIDTAGIRRTEDRIEQIGVERALSAVDQADLILYVIDGASGLDEDDRSIAETIWDKKVITLINKSDLPLTVSKENVQSLLSSPVIYVSAREHLGMDDFSKAVKDMFETGKLVEGEETLLTNVRHFQEITAAKESLEMALESAHQGMPEDFLTIDLMDAYHSLANVIGEDVGEDLIDRIFNSFCMGK